MAGKDSLVLYKGRPARVVSAGEKLELELGDGETARVRPKDVVELHPGPLRSLSELRPPAGEVEAAWELLAGSQTTLAELAELAFGAYTPASAWAAWQLVADGVYFRGTPEAIVAVGAEEAQHKLAARAAEAEEKRAWAELLERVRAGRLSAADASSRHIREVEDLAYGHAQRSRLLAALGREETPENAHAWLLEVGLWDAFVNPHPRRLGVELSIPQAPLPALAAEPRRDLTHLPAFAIDDADSDLPDDALSLEYLPSGARLWVHVADAAALIGPDTPADLEARARGSSLYLPEVTVPMLPPAAGAQLGLGLQEASPAMSFALDMGPAGELLHVEVVLSCVRVTRLTYEEAEQRLEMEPLAGLYRLAQSYRQRRLAAGAVSFDFPEVRLRVADGQVTIRQQPALRSRNLVEEMMIAAGEAAARFAQEHDLPFPFAAHAIDGPAAQPETFSAAIALRKIMRRAQYRSAPAPHAGLGLPAYTQVTSPLRRYLDLVAHQQLRAYLAGAPPLSTAQIVERVGAVEAVMGGLRQAETLSEKHWTLVYLLQHPEWRGEGILVEKRGPRGLFIIPALGLEALAHLPASDLPLDSRLVLTLRGVNLPQLDAYFRVEEGPAAA
jgi:exoribonuclease-2